MVRPTSYLVKLSNWQYLKSINLTVLTNSQSVITNVDLLGLEIYNEVFTIYLILFNEVQLTTQIILIVYMG